MEYNTGILTTLPTKNLVKICRSCIKEILTVSMFDIYVDGLHFPKIWEMCTSIQVESTSSFSNICIKCMDKVKEFYKFRKQCNNSDVILKSYAIKRELNNSDDNSCIVEVDKPREEIDSCIKTAPNIETNNDGFVIDTQPVQTSCSVADDMPRDEIDGYNEFTKHSKVGRRKALDKIDGSSKFTEHLNLDGPKRYYAIDGSSKSTEYLNVDGPKPFQFESNLEQPGDYRALYALYSQTAYDNVYDQGEQFYDGTQFFCNQCEKPFNTEEALRKHSKRHKKGRLQCKTCHTVKTKSTALKPHSESHKTDCKKCGKHFINRSALEAHYHDKCYKAKDLNTKKKKLSEECGKSGSKYKTRSKASQKIIEQDKVPCTICGKSFGDKISMLQHKKCHSCRKSNKKAKRKKGTAKHDKQQL